MKSMRKNEKDYNVFIYRLVYLAGTCMQSDVVLFFCHTYGYKLTL